MGRPSRKSKLRIPPRLSCRFCILAGVDGGTKKEQTGLFNLILQAAVEDGGKGRGVRRFGRSDRFGKTKPISRQALRGKALRRISGGGDTE
jgi:hypothetical protein